MSYSGRITVDLLPPQPATFLEETLVPLMNWGGYFVELLASTPRHMIKGAEKVGSCASHVLAATKDWAVDGLIEILPTLVAYGSHELIISNFSDQPIAYFAQSSVCFASSRYLLWINQLPALERAMPGIARDMQMLAKTKKGKLRQLLAMPEVHIIGHLSPNEASINLLRSISGVTLNITGAGYLAQGTYLVLNKLFG